MAELTPQQQAIEDANRWQLQQQGSIPTSQGGTLGSPAYTPPRPLQQQQAPQPYVKTPQQQAIEDANKWQLQQQSSVPVSAGGLFGIGSQATQQSQPAAQQPQTGGVDPNPYMGQRTTTSYAPQPEAKAGGAGMLGYSLTGNQPQTGGADPNPYMANGGGVALGYGATANQSSGGADYATMGAQPTSGPDNQYNADNPQSRTGTRQPGWGPSQNLFGFGGQQQFQGNYQQAPTGINAPANLANGAPDFFNLANQQSGYNRQNALFQNQMNNPNYYNPAGSQTRTQNLDGSWSVNQSLNPALQRGYEQQNELKTQLLTNAQQIAGQGALNYGNLGSMPQFDTSGVRGIPESDANNLAQMRDSVYGQQTQYLDPQFQQAQGDLENKLANQGITPGSEAYNREMQNFAQTKQRAYGDARNSAIQAGGAEQSRLFGLGLQAHTTGTNDAMGRFNTGMMGRQQGVSETNALRNAPINELNALNGITNTVQLPNFPGQTSTSIPGVDFMNAGQLQNNANLGISNANAARSQNNINGLYGLGSAFLQSGVGQNLLNNMFGGDTNAYNNWLGQNQQYLNAGMTPEDIAGMF